MRSVPKSSLKPDTGITVQPNNKSAMAKLTIKYRVGALNTEDRAIEIITIKLPPIVSKIKATIATPFNNTGHITMTTCCTSLLKFRERQL